VIKYTRIYMKFEDRFKYYILLKITQVILSIIYTRLKSKWLDKVIV